VRTRNFSCMKFLAPALMVAASLSLAAPGATIPKAKLTVFEATLEEPGQRVPEISTEEFKAFLSRKGGIVLDARPRQEFANAHIPGSISIDERGLLRLVQSYPDRSTDIVVYSNGPFCEWAKLRAGELEKLGYTKIARYQLGLSVWRALGNAAETTLEGFRRMFSETATVIVDSRSRAEFSAGTVPAAETVLPGEVASAAIDHRLRYYDRNTRIIVFGRNSAEARALAEEFARNSYVNSSFFGGTYLELKRAKFFSERKPSPSTLYGLTH
jgi:rhodanese-related sulfurtransferase